MLRLERPATTTSTSRRSCSKTVWFRRLPAGTDTFVEIAITDRFDGDFSIHGTRSALDQRRQQVFEGEWTWLMQVHGSEVVVVDHPGAAAGGEADGAVTAAENAVLAVQTADCVPIVLIGDGVVGVVHAGWRGLVAQVVASAVAEIHALNGSTGLRAVIGPCIRPSGYEFGADDLQVVATAVGGDVAGQTSTGQLALDMPAAVTLALRAAGVDWIDDLGFDTSDERWFSHRTRGETGRQVTAARLVRS